MSKRKMHRFYLSAIRFILTFAPFVYIFICLSIQMFSFGDNGFSWSTDIANFGIDGGAYIVNVGNMIKESLPTYGLVGKIYTVFEYFFNNILSIERYTPLFKFCVPCLSWFVVSQLAYFVFWVFDFIIDFVMDIGERFMNRGSKQ